MRLHHVGVVVKDLVQQGEAYRSLLGMAPDSEVILDPLQSVRARFWRDPHGAIVELLEPTGPESPIWRESQKGGGLHHLCYETPDLDQAIHAAVQKGAKITRPSVPAIAFGGRRIVFLYFLDLGLIELLENKLE
jgi:methylmalonyl-CoA/ethylmalonyl-CoA epimerase